MTPEVSRSYNIARVVTKFTNPPILSVLLLVLIAFTKSSRVSDSLVYITTILVFYVLVPVIYVCLRTKAIGNFFKSVNELSYFLKKRPIDILILAFLLGLPCLLILCFLKAPTILITAVTVLLAGSIVTSVFNLFYRVSYHLTGITILVIVTAHAWGPIYLISMILIPLTFWAKYRIHEHTIAQMVTATCISVVFSLVAFKLIC